FEVGGGGVIGIDHEIGMQFRKLSPAEKLTAPTRFIDAFPRRITLWIFEGRASRFLTDRLGGFPARGDLIHSGLNGGGVIRRALKGRLDPYNVRRNLSVAIGKAKVSIGKFTPRPAAVNADRRDQNILGF